MSAAHCYIATHIINSIDCIIMQLKYSRNRDIAHQCNYFHAIKSNDYANHERGIIQICGNTLNAPGANK